MNFESFIAKRLLKGSENKLSKPIVNIAVAAIGVGVAFMILSLAVLLGFQSEIRKKVVGFGSHIQIVSATDNNSKESERVEINQEFYPSLSQIDGVKQIQIFALKPGILETDQDIHGTVIKGVGADFDWDFFGDKIVEGEVLDLDSDEKSRGILISKYQANRLKIEVEEKVTIYFVQNESDIKPRAFRVKGIYETGLEEFDQKFVFVDIRHIQKIANWGVEAQLKVSETCIDGNIQIEALAFGGDKKYTYNWSEEEWRGSGPHYICPQDSKRISVIVGDGNSTLVDTAWVDITTAGDECCNPYVLETGTSGGSEKYYCGGFEVLLEDYDDLYSMDDKIFHEIPFYLQTRNIVQQNPEIFNWLEMLDINVYIIIGLMIFISIINMTSALLIIILEKTRLIGVLKAFGAEDKSIVRIFLRNSAKIVGIGLIIGNVIGIGIALIQSHFGIIELDPASYFVNMVPIEMNWMYIILLDLGCIISCVLFLLIPAWYVSTISPVKAIRFD